MKLYKALKLKNKLANEIAQLKMKVIQKNSRKEGDIEYYDVNELFVEIELKVAKLVALKNAINNKNIEIQKKIYEISEYKGMIMFLKQINTKEGVDKSNRFGEVTEDKYIVDINEIQKEKLIEQYQEMVDEVQEELDLFNHTAEIDFK